MNHLSRAQSNNRFKVGKAAHELLSLLARASKFQYQATTSNHQAKQEIRFYSTTP